ncbi:MAG: FAD-dependent oxidoreductase [Sphingomonas adhaesiva]|uniref:NAD(P)/FAD-dependent oxidoreductase n=1 Tax=Sphingomonas adhaesiva TaxID=28212 RepID=UPI002FFA8549
MFAPAPDLTDRHHRVVIVGGGVAGLDLAGILSRDSSLDVVLVDCATIHVWKPMLHSVAAGTCDVAHVGVPYAAQARRHGFTYVPGRAEAVDPSSRVVHVAPFALHRRPLLPERTLEYDTLVLAVGSVAADFGVEGVAVHARHIDTLEEATAFQADIAPRLIEAAQTATPLRIAIVGGGATGVQLAAELLQMADIADDYGAGGVRQSLEINLLDRGDRLLSAFPEGVSRAARVRLEQLGVTVTTEAVVTAVDATGLQVGNEHLSVDLCVWAAGVEAAPLAETLAALERTREGRIVVDAWCRSVSFTEIVALGDCAALTPTGQRRPLSPTAQVAYQQAVYLGRWLPKMIAGRKAPPFRYRDLGALVQLGGYDAYGALGRFGVFGRGFLHGRMAKAGHAFLYRRHQMRLHGTLAALALWVADHLVNFVRPTSKLS